MGPAYVLSARKVFPPASGTDKQRCLSWIWAACRRESIPEVAWTETGWNKLRQFILQTQTETSPFFRVAPVKSQKLCLSSPQNPVGARSSKCAKSPRYPAGQALNAPQLGIARFIPSCGCWRSCHNSEENFASKYVLHHIAYVTFYIIHYHSIV
jgi:hypothetical protein